MSSTKILVLDGQSDSISLGITNVSGTLAEGSSAFTISAWLKPSSLSAAASRHGVSNIFFARTGDGTPDVFELGISQDGNLQVMTRASAGKQVDTVGNGELTVGEWHFVGLSFDSGMLTAILNNTKYIVHVAAPFSNPEPSPVSVGTNNRGIFFDGSILDVRVWSIARTEDAIKGDKTQWMLGSEPSLISNWQLIDEVADAMENAGPAVWEAVGEIAEGLDVAFDATGAEIGEAMEYAGYTASETIEGLKIAKDKTEAGIAEALDYSNYTINEIADGIEDVYDASYNVIADALEYANRWDIDEIGGALQHIGATTAEALADALQYAGFAVDEVGYFLKDVGGFADDVVNDALVAAGYVASAIEEFMEDAFGWVGEVLDPGNW